MFEQAILVSGRSGVKTLGIQKMGSDPRPKIRKITAGGWLGDWSVIAGFWVGIFGVCCIGLSSFWALFLGFGWQIGNGLVSGLLMFNPYEVDHWALGNGYTL